MTTRIAATLILAALFTTHALAQSGVVAKPSTISFRSPDQSATIRLTHNDTPIPAASILGYDLLVDTHTYEYMISFERKDGAVTIAPTDQVEIGSYNLVIKTAHGPVTVTLYTPLTDLENIVQEQAKALGLTEQEVKERLGIAKRFGTETITFESPIVVYQGNTLTIPTPCPPGRAFEWRLNGEAIHQGGEATPLTRAFPEIGHFALEYRESAEGRPAASGIATILVVPPPTPATVE